jgi:hypothetical protein
MRCMVVGPARCRICGMSDVGSGIEVGRRTFRRRREVLDEDDEDGSSKITPGESMILSDFSSEILCSAVV